MLWWTSAGNVGGKTFPRTERTRERKRFGDGDKDRNINRNRDRVGGRDTYVYREIKIETEIERESGGWLAERVKGGRESVKGWDSFQVRLGGVIRAFVRLLLFFAEDGGSIVLYLLDLWTFSLFRVIFDVIIIINKDNSTDNNNIDINNDIDNYNENNDDDDD